MSLPEKEAIIKNLVDCCAKAPKTRELLKCVDGRKKYTEIAKKVGMAPTNCLNILKKLEDFGLINKKEKGVYQKNPILKYLNINYEIKKYLSKKGQLEEKIKIKKPRKKIDIDPIKKEMDFYLNNNFTIIKHPFDERKKITLSKNQLDNATENFLKFLEYPLENEKIEGLTLRFYDSFAGYFSQSRINRVELINAFGSLIKMYEPFLKKVATLKHNDEKWLNASLNQKLIENICNFNAEVNKKDENYWKSKNVKEAAIRYVYPYRHIEAHESRDYSIFEIEKIVYYMFASIILICLES